MRSLLTLEQQHELEHHSQVDFSFGLDGIGRFRANAYKQRNTYALALRVIPFRVRSLEELGAPWAANELLNRPYGLVLVVGPTGSGKSTTLAAMIDRINEHEAGAHPHHRGPHRVPAPPQGRDGQPARSGHRREQLPRRSAQRPA